MNKTTTPFGALIGAMFFVIIAAIIIIASRVHATDGQAPNGRLITIHDRGVEKVILSSGATIADALVDAGVLIDINDVVEPAASEKMVATDYQVNIYRARPVIVVDGAIKRKIITPYQTPEQIAKSADMTLYPEDTTRIEQADVIADGASIRLTIERATVVNLVLYGTPTTIRTHAKTVGELLKDKNITLAADDTLSVASTQPITANMNLELWRNGVQTATQEEIVQFDIEKIQDADQPIGYSQIKTSGENGKKTVTYEIVMKNGVEQSRTVIQSVVTQEAKKQVMVVGVKLPTPTNPTEAQALGHQMMLNFGYSESEWPCLYNLWMRESGWRTTAGNTSSGAYGIPQSLPATKMAAYGADYLTNASVQITWGLNYIKGRYTTPCGAWSSFQVKGWY